MPVINKESGTAVDEIADGIYRISTPVPVPDIPGGFSFNQYLVDDEAPLLFHTGMRAIFPLVRSGVEHVMPVDRLRYLSFSHFEADECGALNDFLEAAPKAEPLCGSVAAMLSIGDYASRPPKVLADGETLSLGRHTVRWIDTPHLPHNWECGFLFEETTKTLFCGDLLTQPGPGTTPVTEDDVLGQSEAMRQAMDDFSHTKNLRPLMGKLTALQPRTLAIMHGSAFRGDGAAMLNRLADALEAG